MNIDLEIRKLTRITTLFVSKCIYTFITKFSLVQDQSSRAHSKDQIYYTNK